MDYQAQEIDQGNHHPFAPVTTQFDIPATVKSGEVAAGTFGAYEIDTYDSTSSPARYVIKRPTADSLAGIKLAFTSGAATDASSEAQTVSVALNPTRGVWVTYYAPDGVPVAGDEVGTIEDSYLVSSGNTGMHVIAVDTVGGLCLVRPFSNAAVAGASINTVAYVKTAYEALTWSPAWSTHTSDWATFATPFTTTAGGLSGHLKCDTVDVNANITTSYASYPVTAHVNFFLDLRDSDLATYAIPIGSVDLDCVGLYGTARVLQHIATDCFLGGWLTPTAGKTITDVRFRAVQPTPPAGDNELSIDIDMTSISIIVN